MGIWAVICGIFPLKHKFMVKIWQYLKIGNLWICKVL